MVPFARHDQDLEVYKILSQSESLGLNNFKCKMSIHVNFLFQEKTQLDELHHTAGSASAYKVLVYKITKARKERTTAQENFYI